MYNLSKSRYTNGLKCLKILWLDIHKNEEKEASAANQTRMDTGIKAGELARDYFGPYALVPYNDDSNIMLAETRRLLAAQNQNQQGLSIICEATFANEDGLCRVDILRCYDDGVEMLEVKSSAGVKPQHLDDLAFQYHILNSCGIKVKKACILHINTGYERIGELEIQKLFTLADCTNEVKEKQEEVIANIRKIKEIAGGETEPDIPMGEHCDISYSCPYKQYCLKQAQKPIIDCPKIKSFIETLSYPLYFLDFETFRETIPSFDHQKPYQQIPCQYSIHIQKNEGAEPEHIEFLAEAGIDPRRTFAERLCADIPKGACVLAWNMSTEKGYIAGLAALFPDLAPHLMAIHDNIKDLIIPFRKKAWRGYAQGSNSLKDVVPAMFPDDPELNYGKLEFIRNGMEAMDAFGDLPNKSPDEQKQIRAALLAYCRHDTFVMVKILEKLKSEL